MNRVSAHSRVGNFLTAPPSMPDLWNSSRFVSFTTFPPFLFSIALGGAFALLSMLVHLYPMPWALFFSILGIAAGITAYRHVRCAAPMLLIVFMLSPRLDPAQGDFPLRIEDVICASIALATLLRRARRPASFTSTPLDLPLVLFVSCALISICLALISGTLTLSVPAWLTLAKILEYFFAFMLTCVTIRDEADRRLLIRAIIACGLLISLFGVAEYAADQLTAYSPSIFPFRIFNTFPYKGESNHIAGMLMILFAITTAMALNKIQHTFKAALPTLLCSGLFFVVIILTGSRMAFALTVLITLAMLLKTSWKIGLSVLLIGAAAVFVFGATVRERLSWLSAEWRTYRSSEARVEAGYPPEFSYTRNRFEVWSLLRKDIQQYPWWGSGPGSRHRVLYENQYMMTLCEMGWIGLAALMFVLMWALRGVLSSPAPISGLALAFLGVCALGLVSNAFMISRIAGPLWILIGSVMQATSGTRTGASRAGRAR